MNFKAIFGYVTSIVGVVATHSAGLPWWVQLITATVGTAAAHVAPQPGQGK